MSTGQVDEEGRRPRAGDEPTSLALHWTTTALHLARRLRRADVDLDVPAAQLSALSMLVGAGPHTIGELAAYEQVTPQTMTYLVTQLEAHGLVRRTRDEADRRIVHVTATRDGRAVIERGRMKRVEWLERQFAQLSAADRRALARAERLLHGLLESRD